MILTITESAKELVKDGEAAQTAFAKIIFDGFCDEEMNKFREMFSKMYENANRVLSRK